MPWEPKTSYNEEWHKDIPEAFTRFRENVGDQKEEFIAQQQAYTKFANLYDNYNLNYEGYQAHAILTAELNDMVQDRESKILDFGAGTGLGAEELKKVGFTNIDGLDCSKEMLDVAKEKERYKKYILTTGSPSDTENIPDNTYDVICSIGTFFVTKSHPGAEFFSEMARITKPGGLIIVITCIIYLDAKFHRWDLIKALESEGVLKVRPIKEVPGYKLNTNVHGGAAPPNAAVMCYDIVKQGQSD